LAGRQSGPQLRQHRPQRFNPDGAKKTLAATILLGLQQDTGQPACRLIFYFNLSRTRPKAGLGATTVFVQQSCTYGEEVHEET